MGIAIAVESVERLDQAELWPLFEDHREELTTNKALMTLAPDMPRYIACEQAGALFVLTARDEGRLVGYSVNFIGQHLHYSALRYANNDLLFLAKTHRKGTLGLRLIRETEREAKARGARLMVWHAKSDSALHQMFDQMAPYRVQDIMYSRTLG